MSMVDRTNNGPVCLLVDEVGDVFGTGRVAIRQHARNHSPTARELLNGVYKLEDRLLLVLDMTAVVDVSLLADRTE